MAKLTKAANDPRTGETEVTLEAQFLLGGRATVHVATDAPSSRRHQIDVVGEMGALRLLNQGRDYIDGFQLFYIPRSGDQLTLVSQAGASDGNVLQGAAPTQDGRTEATVAARGELR